MSKQRILVIEDEEYLRDLYAEILFDYNVETVKDGIQALKKKRKYDLYIVDVGLPGIDGLSTIEKLKEIHGNIKTIVVTGYDVVKYTREIDQCGPNIVLQKPFKVVELMKMVKIILNHEV